MTGESEILRGIKPDRDIPEFFPKSQRVTYRKVKLGPAELAAVQGRLGYRPARPEYVIFVATTGEHVDGYAIIDHKSFPGSRDQWDERAIRYGTQLDLYAEAVEAATGRPCKMLFVHMPLVGALLRVSRTADLANSAAAHPIWAGEATNK